MNEGARQENEKMFQRASQDKLESIARKLDRIIELLDPRPLERQGELNGICKSCTR